jgi:hypothetical protein
MSFFLNLEKTSQISLKMQYHTQPLLMTANLHHIRRLSDGLAMHTTWGARERVGISTRFLIHTNVCYRTDTHAMP